MLLSTKFSPRNYNTAIFARIAYHMYVNRISALFLWLIFMSLNFAYFPKDTAASVATVIWQVGSSVLLSEKRWPVLQVWIAVANSCWRQRHLIMSQPRYATKVAPIHPNAVMIMHDTCVWLLPSLSTWRSVSFTTAMAIFAMKAKYQWSAASCSWHAPL